MSIPSIIAFAAALAGVFFLAGAGWMFVAWLLIVGYFFTWGSQ